MWLFKFCSFLGVSLFVFSGVAARDLSDMQFRFDSSDLMPSTSQGDNSDPLNIMSASAAARSMSYKDEASKRGAEEASIYQKVSTGTVLIATDDGLGAGAVITNNGHILTNQHVVGSSQKVKIFFKPIGGSNDMAKAVQVIGTVLKVNTKTDLALIKVEKMPTFVRPIAFKLDGPPAIGEDAHAVGHPRGEVWTYTRGYVSQYRLNYVWITDNSVPSRAADVIQTQTPINPGNSGGPLVNQQGHLIGLNSFVDPKSPGLNFAIAISSIQSFLKQEGSVIEKNNSTVDPKNSSSGMKCGKDPVGQKEGEWKSNPATLIFYDPDCIGTSTVVKIIPRKTDEPIGFIIQDKSKDKGIIGLFDFDRDGQIDYTLFDSDGDGIWDFSGENLPGESVASDLKPVKKG